jgi:ribosome-associated heat shock protein Hsp15
MARIDKYLWAIRIYKTRTLAADAIKGGKVKFEHSAIKPSKEVKPGDVFTIQSGPIQKTIEVIELTEQRHAAKEAVNYYKDLTSPEEYQKLIALKNQPFMRRDRGTGRPTKKERRDIDDLLDDL